MCRKWHPGSEDLWHPARSFEWCKGNGSRTAGAVARWRSCYLVARLPEYQYPLVQLPPVFTNGVPGPSHSSPSRMHPTEVLFQLSNDAPILKTLAFALVALGP